MDNKDIVQRIWPFFIVFSCYLFIASAMIQYFGRDDLHLFINQFHHPFFDQFFKYYTDAGTTGMLVALSLYIVWKSNWANLAYLVVTELLASIPSVITKKYFFKHVHRPSYYFYQNNIDLHLIEGAKIQIPYTFPSGHTLLGVIIAMTLCTMTKKRWLQFIFALHFPMIAFSRMYLSKHFAIDTIGGATLGFFMFIFVYYTINHQSKQFIFQPIRQRNGSRK